MFDVPADGNKKQKHFVVLCEIFKHYYDTYGFMITSMFMQCNTIFSRHVTRVNKHNVSDVTTFGPDAGIGAIKSFDVIASNDTFIMPSKFISYMYRRGVNVIDVLLL